MGFPEPVLPSCLDCHQFERNSSLLTININSLLPDCWDLHLRSPPRTVQMTLPLPASASSSANTHTHKFLNLYVNGSVALVHFQQRVNWIPGFNPPSLLKHLHSLFFFLINIFYWSLIDLLCFRCTVRWFGYTYTHQFFSNYFPL